jgi:2-haloacid dehalogenase
VVISNIDDDLFAQTQKYFDVEFEGVITAQQARSYKPSVNNFQIALRRLALAPDRWLHAGQSIYHDVVPARSLGISTVWVNRKSARPGIGAVRGSAGKPDLEVPDLASLVAMMTGD